MSSTSNGSLQATIPELVRMDPLLVEHEARQATTTHSPASARPRRHVRFQLDPKHQNSGQQLASSSRMSTRSASKASQPARPSATKPTKKRKIYMWSLGYAMPFPTMFDYAIRKNLFGNEEPRGSGLLGYVLEYFRAFEEQHNVHIYVRWVRSSSFGDEDPFITISTIRSATRPAPPDSSDASCKLLQALLEEERPPKWCRSSKVPWDTP